MMSGRAHYRFYCVSPNGRFLGVETAECETDEAAREHARERLHRLHHCTAIEVWQLSRLVGQLRKTDA